MRYPLKNILYLSITSILYVGVFASLSAFVLWNKAIVTVGLSKAGIIYYTLPLYNVSLIVSGIFAANYESKK